MSEFVTKIEHDILSHRLLQAGDSVLVAVSGGLDSMVLLRTLHSLGATHRWKLAVAHFNHLLRGAESNADERFVASAAKKLGLPFRSARADVLKLAKEKGLSVEMAARSLRHEFLAHTAAGLGFRKIALAHHANDQVELFFVRLCRGAGTQGLGGMEWSSPSPAGGGIALLRPFLATGKRDLAEHAREQKISFREDSSNRSNAIQRNHIRNKLLPLLRRDYQLQIDGAVLRSMDLIHGEGEFVTLEAIRWLEIHRPAKAFDELHFALQRRVVQIELLAAGVVPQFEHVELLRRRVGEWVSVRAGMLCRRSAGGRIETQVGPPATQPNVEAAVELGGPRGQVNFGPLAIQWSLAAGCKLPARRNHHAECFDADRVGASVLLRHWRDGDRFQPIGMSGSVKLQDLFVNQKVPRAHRHQLAVATTASGDIFWVEDLRIGELFKVTAATRRILKWRWKR